MFLIGDAASAAKSGQKVPSGYYNIELMLSAAAKSVCGTGMDARGLAETELAEGARRGTPAMLGAWTEWADRVLVF